MARTADQIENDLSKAITSMDSSYDTVQGPVKDLFTVPISSVISRSEQEAESLRLLFSLQFASSATELEIKNALNNYGSRPSEGTKSSHNQHFLRFTRPKEDITIPSGSLVSNNTANLVYRTLGDVTMLASQADTYYNPSRKAYEIVVTVEADGIGSEYALPANRIQTILTPIIGIDATENREKSSQGLPSETTTQQAARLQSILLGLNLNTQGGIPARIMEVMAGVVSLVQVITPAMPEFKRTQVKPSIDVYVYGSLEQIAVDTITAINGQTEIVLSKQPVSTVLKVIVNNTTALTFSLVKDSSNETGYSVNSQDYLLVQPLSSGDVVEITYTYNKILEDTKSLVFNDAAESLFSTDYLIREFLKVSPIISLELKVLSSYAFDNVSNDIRAYIEASLNNPVLISKIAPNDFRQNIMDNVSGIQSLRILKFRRDTGSLSTIETVVLNKNEVTNYKLENVDIKAVR